MATVAASRFENDSCPRPRATPREALPAIEAKLGFLRGSRRRGLFGRRHFARAADRPRRFDLGDAILVIAQYLAQNLVRMLAEQRRAHDFRRAVGELDRVADGEIFAAL